MNNFLKIVLMILTPLMWVVIYCIVYPYTVKYTGGFFLGMTCFVSSVIQLAVIAITIVNKEID